MRCMRMSTYTFSGYICQQSSAATFFHCELKLATRQNHNLFTIVLSKQMDNQLSLVHLVKLIREAKPLKRKRAMFCGISERTHIENIESHKIVPNVELQRHAMYALLP